MLYPTCLFVMSYLIVLDFSISIYREIALFSQVEFIVRKYSVLKVRIIIHVYNHVL